MPHLDTYRRSFAEAYEWVVATIRMQRALDPTGRPAKSTTSVIEKLRRESIRFRLTQMQDIAGCRLIVPDIAAQETAVEHLRHLFEQCDVVDRRDRPSHGYRAVHVIVTRGGKLIEIQVRTSLQHLWAELSEKLSDVEDPAIKYGAGDVAFRALLTTAATTVAGIERAEAATSSGRAQGPLSGEMIQETERRITSAKTQLVTALTRSIAEVAAHQRSRS